MATLLPWLYSALGLSGLGALFYVIRSIMQWGASKEREDRASEKQEIAEDETKKTARLLAEVGRQRDVANEPAADINDILDRMSKNQL